MKAFKQSDALRKDLHDRFPEDTVANQIYLPVLTAVLAVYKGNASEAVEDLQVTTTREMAMVGDGSAMLGNVHSPYIRGEALFRAGRGRRGSQSSRRLWIILESGSLIRLVRPLICKYREAIASWGTEFNARGAYEVFKR
jgi:hypothetical protein